MSITNVADSDYPKISQYKSTIFPQVHLEGSETWGSTPLVLDHRFSSSTIFITAQFTNIWLEKHAASVGHLNFSFSMYVDGVLDQTFYFGGEGANDTNLNVSGIFAYGNTPTQSNRKTITFIVARDNANSDTDTHIEISGKLVVKVEEHSSILLDAF
jgi:hypothetical protein